MSEESFSIQEDADGCAAVARAHRIPTIGNAPGSETRGIVFVEFPMPWAPKVDETSGFPTELLAITKRHGYKLFAVTPSETALTQEDVMRADFPLRLLIYQRPNGPFKRYKALELQIPRNVIKQVVSGVLSGSLGKGKRYIIDERDEKARKDVFICIHGSRDKCCGDYGMQLLSEIKSMVDSSVRLRGVSHVGKHIFAPNVMIFPEGQLWGHVSASLLKNIITRSGSIQEVLPCYRGTIGFDVPVQVLEQEILKREGWKWFDYHRQGWAIEENAKNGKFKVMIDYFDDEMKKVGSYEGQVEVVKAKNVLTSSCNPKIRYKLSKVIELTHSVFKLDDHEP